MNSMIEIDTHSVAQEPDSIEYQRVTLVYTEAMSLQRKLDKWVIGSLVAGMTWSTIGSFLFTGAILDVIGYVLFGVAATAFLAWSYATFDLRERYIRVRVGNGLLREDAAKQFKKEHPIYGVWAS